jgi:putative transcriptional regulator
MNPLFKNDIKVFRARFNMSQEDLAIKVGVRRETIGNLEKGKYNPSLVLAMQIAAVFQVKVDDIFQLLDNNE